MVERTLVERAQRGDRDAYERIALEVADPLFRLAYRIVRDLDQAEDAVQQTLITIWTDLPGLRDADRFDAWTYRLTVRFCLAESRRHRRIGVTLVPLTEATSVGPDLADEVVSRERLDRAFRMLSSEHRAVLVLRHQLGLSLPEVASIVGVRYGTVGSRLHRAATLLRAAIDAEARAAALGKGLA